VMDSVVAALGPGAQARGLAAEAVAYSRPITRVADWHRVHDRGAGDAATDQIHIALPVVPSIEGVLLKPVKFSVSSKFGLPPPVDYISDTTHHCAKPSKPERNGLQHRPEATSAKQLSLIFYESYYGKFRSR
jgi:hypothetical protein